MNAWTIRLPLTRGSAQGLAIICRDSEIASSVVRKDGSPQAASSPSGRPPAADPCCVRGSLVAAVMACLGGRVEQGVLLLSGSLASGRCPRLTLDKERAYLMILTQLCREGCQPDPLFRMKQARRG
jgi:hypothetical protein